MVAEVVAELIVSRLVYQHIRRNTVNFELFAKVLPLLVVQTEMFSFDVWNRLFVSDERRRFVGQVNPYQVVALQFLFLQRFVGTDRHAARSAPGVPEIHQDNFSLVGRNDGLEELVWGNFGCLFDNGFSFYLLESNLRVFQHFQNRIPVERVVYAFKYFPVGLGQ